MDWQKYFTLKTLDRGLAYYENGNVLELMQTSHGYEAVVQSDSGNEYEVNIEIENDELIMNCDCIYGQEMGYCKHMAAVLYAVEEGAEMIQQHDLSKLINRLSTQKLREILLSVSDQRAVKYKLQLLAENDPQTVLKQRLNQIIRKYSIAMMNWRAEIITISVRKSWLYWNKIYMKLMTVSGNAKLNVCVMY